MRTFSSKHDISGAMLVCLVALLGSQLSLSTAHRLSGGGGARGRVFFRRALLQTAPNVTTEGNATDIAFEAVNTTTSPSNRTTATIFAPTDAAFASLAAALKLSSPLDLFNETLNPTAANITALHVIPGEEITTANLTTTPNITAPSLLGYDLAIVTEPNGTVTVTVPGSDVVARVITPDVPYNGSIVHVIDKVLLPPANVTAAWPVPLPPSAEGA